MSRIIYALDDTGQESKNCEKITWRYNLKPIFDNCGNQCCISGSSNLYSARNAPHSYFFSSNFTPLSWFFYSKANCNRPNFMKKWKIDQNKDKKNWKKLYQKLFQSIVLQSGKIRKKIVKFSGNIWIRIRARISEIFGTPAPTRLKNTPFWECSCNHMIH